MPLKKGKKSFHPGLETAEARVLATTGLTGPVPHPAAVKAESRPKAQAWVEVFNRTDQALSFGLQADPGAGFHTEHLRPHSSAYYHVNHAASSFAIEIGDAVTTLAASPTRATAEPYSIRASFTLTGPGLTGGSPGGAGTGSGSPEGGPGSTQNLAKFSIINQTSKPSGAGGFPVTVSYSVDGGRTFPYSGTIPYTNGRTPTGQSLYYGQQGIYCKLSGNTSQVFDIQSDVTYFIFVNSNFQPYLYPN